MRYIRKRLIWHKKICLNDLSYTVSQFNFGLAVKLQLFLDRDRLGEVINSPNVPFLSASSIIQVAEDFQRRSSTIAQGVTLLDRWMHFGVDRSGISMVKHCNILCLIGSGSFNRAIAEISNGRSFFELAVHDAFNYAMAQWGETGIVPVDLFAHILSKPHEVKPTLEANSFQCFSIANWCVGNESRATDLYHAMERITKVPESAFSCWSYLFRSAKPFMDDLNKMKDL